MYFIEEFAMLRICLFRYVFCRILGNVLFSSSLTLKARKVNFFNTAVFEGCGSLDSSD